MPGERLLILRLSDCGSNEAKGRPLICLDVYETSRVFLQPPQKLIDCDRLPDRV